MRAPALPDTIASEFNRMRELTSTNLRDLIDASGKSRRHVARELQLTARYVDSRATGTVELSASDLALFATYLEVPVSRFFDETPVDTTPTVAKITRLTPNRRLSDYSADHRGLLTSITDAPSRRHLRTAASAS